MEARAAGEERGWRDPSKQLPVDSRGGAHRPGYRRPEGRRRTERPIHSTAGLELEAGVIVVLDLGAESHVQSVGNEGDLVLDKSGEPLSRDVARQEGKDRAVGDAIVDQAVAESPDQVMPGAYPGTVLELDVV